MIADPHITRQLAHGRLDQWRRRAADHRLGKVRRPPHHRGSLRPAFAAWFGRRRRPARTPRTATT